MPPPPLIEGVLLKESDNTHNLHERYFQFHADGLVRYWMNEDLATRREPPRGEGKVVDGEEWWPKSNAASKGLRSVAKNVKLATKYATSHQYDGRTFTLTILPTPKSAPSPAATPGDSTSSSMVSVKLHTYRLVAPTRADRVQWLLVTAQHLQARITAPPTTAPDEEEAGETAPSPTEVAALVPDPRRKVLDVLPTVWKMWKERGENDAAFERYAALLREDPSCWQLLQDRGNFLLWCGEPRRAEADFSAAIDMHASRPELWNDRAVSHMDQGHYVEAAADIEHALKLRPEFAEALSNLGNVRRQLGQLRAAKAAYDSALLLKPKDSRTWNNRGALQEELGNLVAAELDMARAIELGGCPKALDNCMRIKEQLMSGAQELVQLPPCSLITAPGSLVRFTFEDGPLGLFLVNPVAGEIGKIIIKAVEDASQAERIGVPVGGVVVALNGQMLGDLGHADFLVMLQKQERPVTLVIRWPEAPQELQDGVESRALPAAAAQVDAAADTSGGANNLEAPILLPGGSGECIPGIVD